jgi:O-antigen/teichoic acid export membrane protein
MNQLIQCRKYFTVRPFDTTSEAGRSDERHRRIALTAVLTVLSKFVSLFTPLITIPLTISYLGKQQYGLWMTLASLTVSLGFADLGMGLGLLNVLAECDGKNDRQGSRIYVSSGVVFLTGLAAIFGVLYLCLGRFVPWKLMFHNLPADELRVVPHLFGILFFVLLLNMPLGIVDRVYLALQEGYISSMFQTAGSILALIGVVAAVKLNLGMEGLIIALSGCPLLVLFVSAMNLFGKRHVWIRPRLSAVSVRAIWRLLRLGSMFFVLQFCYTLSYNLDNFVIATSVGLSAVAEYVAPSRLFGIVSATIPIVLNPIWPAYVEAANRGDVPWVRRTLARTLRLVLAITVPANIFLFLSGRIIIKFWTHGQLAPSRTLLAALAIWGVVGPLAGATAIFMNAMNLMVYQSAAAVLMAIGNLGLSVALTRSIGTSGVVWGSIAAQAIMLVPTLWVVIPAALARLDAKAQLAPEHVGTS